MPAGLRGQRAADRAAASASAGGTLIDTNVHIGAWPFRKLKLGETAELAGKLRHHKIREAWTGSFDALFHKNIDSVNRRLVNECRSKGAGILVPFGTVNPTYPDWQEDLRRCHEEHRMRGIRLYPSYHGYRLDQPIFAELLADAAGRGLIVQIVIDMEDKRMQHPLVEVPAVDPAALPLVMKGVPGARVMLLNPFMAVRQDRLKPLVEETDICFEIANLDEVAGLERMFAGKHNYLRSPMPVDRLLFGTHAPFLPVEYGILKLFESALTAPQLAAVMYGNAERIAARA